MDAPHGHPLGWSLHEPLTAPWKGTWPLLSKEEKILLGQTLEQLFQSPEHEETPILPILTACAEERGWALHPRQAEYLHVLLTHHTQGMGAVSPLLKQNIEELSITGIGPDHPVRVYDSIRGWRDTPLYFTDAPSLIALINRIARESGSRLSGENPILNARILEGMRIHAAIAPVSQSPIEASIRRFTQRPTHPAQLLPSRIWNSPIIAYLERALTCDCNMMIAGNTGSGKTTTLNALAHLFPPEERIVTIEETPELSLSHPHRVSLSPKNGTPFDLSRLIRETLRMRPDRVIVGEVRFPEEARALMESILSGQGKGTYSTFHGHSSRETLARLRQYGLLDQDLGWVDVMVIQRRWTQTNTPLANPISVRKIVEIVELEYDSSKGLTLHPVFTYNPRTDEWDFFSSVKVAERFQWYFPQQNWETFLHEKIRKKSGGNAHARSSHSTIRTRTNHSAVGIGH